jgi:alkanesulfonate monooxygenase SsuD/methylene tetrahydromethanopterin reductase-like flavin-dependent oxidoreductase (luciferase family)
VPLVARPEVWTTGIAWPGVVERAARRAEAAGFDGLAVVDSQNLPRSRRRRP